MRKKLRRKSSQKKEKEKEEREGKQEKKQKERKKDWNINHNCTFESNTYFKLDCKQLDSNYNSFLS